MVNFLERCRGVKTMTVVVVGSINVDIIFEIERMPVAHEKLRAKHSFVVAGGSGANTAYWLAQLGHAVEMVGVVGSDPLGDFALKELDRAGVGTSRCLRAPGSTGVAAIFINQQCKTMVTGRPTYSQETVNVMIAEMTAAS